MENEEDNQSLSQPQQIIPYSSDEQISEDIVVDYSNEFTTYDIFPSRQKLIDWVCDTGKRLGFVIIILKSDTGASSKKPRIMFACERSGVYKKRKEISPKNLRMTGTKKCNCPFRLKGEKLPTLDDWRLHVMNGVHNHLELKNEEGHSHIGRLNKDETKLVVEMHRNMVKAKEILHTIKRNDPTNRITIKTIYNVGEEELLCGCVVRRTHGLPCAHELARLGPGIAVSLDMIDVHWTRLHLVEISGKKDMGVVEKMELLLNDVKKMETPYQMQIYKKMLEVVEPRTSSLTSPKSKIKTRGRERKKRANTSTKRMPSAFELVESVYSQSSCTSKKTRIDKLPIRKPKKLEELSKGMRTYVHQISLELKAFVTDIIDVRSDGNCGYRCVAALLGLGESSWSQIRRELYEELYENQSLYDRVFIENGRSTNLLKSFKYEDEGFAPVEKWMSMPDVGYIIATRYNVVVFTISERLVLTIPPLKGKVPQPIQRMEIAIAFVNQDHFVQVKLEPKHPVPPIYSKWYTARDTDASKWEYIYNDRRQAWDERNAFAN